MTIETTPEVEGEVTCRIRGRLSAKPRFISVRVSASGTFQVERGGAWEDSLDYRRLDYASGKEIEEVLHLRPGKGAPVSVEVLIGSDEDLLELRPAGGDRVFRNETFVRIRRRIG